MFYAIDKQSQIILSGSGSLQVSWPSDKNFSYIGVIGLRVQWPANFNLKIYLWKSDFSPIYAIFENISKIHSYTARDRKFRKFAGEGTLKAKKGTKIKLKDHMQNHMQNESERSSTNDSA